MVSRHWFINAAGSLTTSLGPEELLQELLAVERGFGRTRDPSVSEYRDRTLDLDLLLYEDVILSSSDLVLPHPAIEYRLFVLYPLGEIAPEYVHPRLRKTIRELLLNLERKQDTAPVVAKVSWKDRK
jgi:2-amino-4-hydroxy-6-hydroxymethyldihydropteridine diphosphokinase